MTTQKHQATTDRMFRKCAVILGFIGIMENQMETTIVYWGFIGIMEKKMEATIV